MLHNDDPTPDNVENVRVFIRIRPLKDLENNEDRNDLIKLNDNVITLRKSDKIKTFKFSKIFDENSTQIDLYRCVAVPIVEKVLRGYNGTIFAYGQSGTGKTYTMIGDVQQTQLKGIVPNVFSHIFTQISLADSAVSYALTVTYLEIYNEEIRDLLSETPAKKLTVHEKPGIGVYVKDLLGFAVDSLEAITEILTKGNRNRATGSTKLNDTSSRSHAIFTILIETKNKTTNDSTYGKLNLVDLAGSERVTKTLATGYRLREAGKINMSLSVLGNVISALVDGKASHVPYRNSKLTRLLQDSLGGNSLTSMVAMISPNILDSEESMFTLMYADRVKHIRNYVRINTEKKSLIETFEIKISELKQQLHMLNLEEQKEKKKERRKCKNRTDEQELDKIEMEKCVLENKINMIQKKILIGGENLLEKAHQQIVLLEGTAKELKHLDSSHQLLEEILFYKGKEKSMMGKKYINLLEEEKELDRKIEGTETLLSQANDILVKKETEYQNEISALLHTNKALAKEMGLVNFIVNNFVPKDHLDAVKSNVVWDDDIQEWQIKGIAYCGNNLRMSRPRVSKDDKGEISNYKKYH